MTSSRGIRILHLRSRKLYACPFVVLPLLGLSGLGIRQYHTHNHATIQPTSQTSRRISVIPPHTAGSVGERKREKKGKIDRGKQIHTERDRYTKRVTDRNTDKSEREKERDRMRQAERKRDNRVRQAERKRNHQRQKADRDRTDVDNKQSGKDTDKSDTSYTDRQIL